jgi:hypothetical protein
LGPNRRRAMTKIITSEVILYPNMFVSHPAS